ncbi:unnamed protein product [Adineta steineri]|nr:unnamed protein product [Adineta steineri]
MQKTNGSSIDNGGVRVRHSATEQDIHVDNVQYESSTQNQPNSMKSTDVTKKIKKSPRTPSPLKYSCWSRHRTATAVGTFALFTILTMAAIQQYELKFIQTPQNPIEYNFGPRSVVVGNFDNDKLVDIVVANHVDDSISVYLGYNNGAFASNMIYSTGLYSAPYMVAIGDFNNDYHTDIAVAYYGTNSIGIFLGSGNCSFINKTVMSTGSSRPIWILIADLDNDTSLDIVTANYGTDSISIFYGSGDGTFSYTITYPMGYDSSPFSVIGADFNNDNYLDLAITNYGTNNIAILIGNGNRTFLYQQTFSTGINSHPYSLIVGHFNDDSLLDIAVANYGANNVGVFLGNINGIFTSQTTYSLNTSSPYSIGLGNFNRDNRVDLVVSNKGTNNIGVLLGLGNGSFSEPTMNPTGSSSSISLAAADFNKDNLLDVIIVSNDTGSVSILFGYDEGFQPQTTYSTGSWPQSVAVGDFNNDTRLDIVVASATGNIVSVLLGYGNGSFANQTTYSTGSWPQSVAVGDFNNDTRLDIVVANRVDNTVSVLLGYGNGSFANQTTYLTGNSPYSVAVGDFNNDIRVDIVVANYRNNTVSVLLG